jgi:hypothetical protein
MGRQQHFFAEQKSNFLLLVPHKRYLSKRSHTSHLQRFIKKRRKKKKKKREREREKMGRKTRKKRKKRK